MNIEEMLITGLNADTSCPYPTCLSVLTCKDLLICEKQGIAAQEPKEDGGVAIFYATTENADSYLKEKFKMGLIDFIRTYTSRIMEGGIYVPICSPMSVCVFRKENDVKLLERQFSEHQSLIVDYPYSVQGTIPNLHDASIYILTLIECEFSIGKNRIVPSAMYHVSEDYSFLIKMSNQQDITIFYEKR